MPATALAPGGLIGRHGPARARRRRRVHHAVQLPDRQHGRQARSRARDGQHRRRAPGVAGPARGDRARASILHDVGFPPGVVNVVTGSTPATGEALVESPDIDMVSFTGSTAVGMQHRRGRRAHDEAPAARARRQGRGASCSTTPTSRPRSAMIGSVWTFHSGQICTAPTRAIVHRSVYDQRRRGAGEDGDGAEGRRPAREGHGRRPAHHRRAPRPRRGLHRSRQATRAARSSPVAAGPRTSTRASTSSRRCIASCRPRHAGRAGGDLRPGDRRRCRSTTTTKAIAIANGTEFGLYDYVFSDDTSRAMRTARATARRQRRDQHGAAQPRDAVRRHQAQRRRSRRRLVRPPRVHRAAVRRVAGLSGTRA